jgi:hypothetical protein
MLPFDSLTTVLLALSYLIGSVMLFPAKKDSVGYNALSTNPFCGALLLLYATIATPASALILCFPAYFVCECMASTALSVGITLIHLPGLLNLFRPPDLPWQEDTYGFGDAAEVDDGDVVGEVFHKRKIVGDDEVGEAEFQLDVGQQVQHLGADGDVERGDRLVQHHEAGAQGQGAGDGDALALAAAEFVRVEAGGGGGEADDIEHLGDALLCCSAAGVFVGEEGFGDDGADAQAGVEGGVGVLEDGHDLAAVILELGRVHGGGVGALEGIEPGRRKGDTAGHRDLSG